MRPQDSLKQMVTVVSWLPPHLRPQKGPGLMVHMAQQVLFVLETALGTGQGLPLGSCPAQGSQPSTQGLGSRSLSYCLCG